MSDPNWHCRRPEQTSSFQRPPWLTLIPYFHYHRNMEAYDAAFFDEDELLPDETLDQLEADLAGDCLSCALRDSGPLDEDEA